MKNLITGAFSLLKASLCINCKLYHNSSKFRFFPLSWKRLRWLEAKFKTSIIFCCGCTFLLYFLEVYRPGCMRSWCIVVLKPHGWVHMVHAVKRNRLIHVCRSSGLKAWWQYFITQTLVDVHKCKPCSSWTWACYQCGWNKQRPGQTGLKREANADAPKPAVPLGSTWGWLLKWASSPRLPR